MCAIITGSALGTLISEVGAQFSDIEFCVNETAMVNAHNFLNTFLKSYFLMISTIHHTHCKYKLSTLYTTTQYYTYRVMGGGVGRAKCRESDTTTRILTTQLPQYTSFALTGTVEIDYKNSAEWEGGRDTKQDSNKD